MLKAGEFPKLLEMFDFTYTFYNGFQLVSYRFYLKTTFFDGKIV